MIESFDCPSELLASTPEPPSRSTPSLSPSSSEANDQSHDTEPPPSRSSRQPTPKPIATPSPTASDRPSTTPRQTSTSTAPSTPTHPIRPTNAELMETCRAFLAYVQRGAPWVVQRLSNAVGEMPTDPGLFSFWVASLIPLDNHEKAKLLPIRSARLRLLLVSHWIEQLNNNWYVKLILFAGFIRWFVSKFTEAVVNCVLWVIAGILSLGISGIGMGNGRRENAAADEHAVRGALVGVSFPAFLLVVALCWAV